LADPANLQKVLGVNFNDPSLLEHALVHSSYVNENPELVPGSNERLEFLGDAILGLVAAEKLYESCPQYSEGEMTKLRAALVRGETLARLAKDIRLGDWLYLGKGEAASGGRYKQRNLAGALEAIIAAICLDEGLDTTRNFILRLFGKEMERLISQGTAIDYKSQLQELLQAKQQQGPSYELIEAVGPSHNMMFTVAVKAGNTVLGRGTGKSRKIAETQAAYAALQQLANNFTL